MDIVLSKEILDYYIENYSNILNNVIKSISTEEEYKN